MKRDVLNSPRLTELKKRRRRSIFNKILFFLFVIVTIFFLFTYISRAESLNIKEIEINGNEIVDTREIEAIVRQEIAGKYLWLFPKTNILFYPQNIIKNVLMDKFKRIKELDLSIEDNKILIINITERVAKYTWCGEVPFQTDEKCHFLDEDGYIFDEAPYFSGEVYFKFFGHPDVGRLDSRRPTSGTYFFGENFDQLILFIDMLIEMKLKPAFLYVNTNKDVEIFLSKGSTAKVQPKIILKLNADLENIGSNLKTALNTEPLKSDLNKKYSMLEYIDLRFENKVYNKFSK